MEKKDFFAPLALGLGATRRAAMLLLVMMLTTATAWAQDDSCGDDLTWEWNGNTLTITGTGAMADYNDSSKRPWDSYTEQINEVVIEDGVTSIGNNAFFDCQNLTSITFAEGSQLESIGESAFNGTGLTSIEIPAGVTSIGVGAFFSCDGLTSVSFAEGSQLESIGESAFRLCSNLTSITIPASVTSIGSYVFQDCDLASMTVADGNTVYDSRNGCNAIIETLTNTLIIGCKNSTIPASVTSIGAWAFYATDLTSIEIPASVTSIGMHAFQSCPNLATVTVYAPSCTLGDYAFAYCNKLENIYVFSDLVDDYQKATNWSDYTSIITGITGGYCGTTGHERDVVWVLTGESPNYTLTISGTGAMEDYDKPDEQPWYNCNGIETIVIENGVTSIGDNVFNGPAPTTVTIPASVTSIGAAAFGGCKYLSMVTFAPGSQLTTIGEGAFNYTGLGSIIIPASVTSIGKEVFGFCGNLSTITVEDGNKVYDSRNGCNAIIETSSNKLIAGCKNSTIPASVTSIGEYAFSGTGLTDVEIPANVTSIGAWAFDKCNYLSNVTFVGTPTLTTIGESAFSITGLTTITIPASVTSIDSYAFSNCECLTSVTFAEGSQLTTIGDGAFSFNGLTTITIPASVTSIGDYAFQNCPNLATVTVYAPSCSLGEDAFYGCNKLANIYVFSDLVDGYKDAENWSNYAERITGITGGYCGTTDHETDVVWVLTGESPNCTLTISGTGAMADYEYSFAQPWYNNVNQIKTIVIENGVTSIGKYAFQHCYNLTSITIPASVTSIGDGAFSSCRNIETMTVAIGNTVYDSRNNCNAIIEKATNTLLFGCKNTVIPDDVTSIGNHAFKNTDLTSVEIPVGVTSIGEAAFSGCDNLGSVTFAEGSQLTTIGEGAFSDCIGLGSITIPAKVTSIGKEVFANCSNLATITVEDGNKVYDSRNGCNAIIETSSNKLIAGCNGTTIPASVTSIGDNAFYCSGLGSITIPASVTSIGMNAFDKCNYLSNVTFAEGSQLTTIGESAFTSTGLTTITIPASVTSIGDHAFENCNALGSVTFVDGSRLMSIGNYAFYACTAMTSVEIPASVTSVGDEAFHDCSGLKSVTLNGEATIGRDAFPNGATVTIAEGMFLHNGTEPLSGNVSDMGKLNGKTLVTAYSVTFDIADDDDDPEAQIVVRGNKVTVPTVARTGYTLKWKVGEEDYDFDTPVNSNIALTAVWTANNYTVQFSANGGSGDAMASMQLTYDGDVAMLPACTYTAPEGKAFKNWNTAADGSGTPYDDERWVRNLTGEPNGTVVLYAQWGKNIAACKITVPNQTLDDYTAVSYKFEAANSGYASTGTTVYDGETLLTLGTDYRFGNVTMANGDPIDWNGSKIGDECKVVIKGIGNYGGTIFKNFTVVSPEANGEWGDLAWTIDADGDFTISKKDGVEGNVAMNETTKGNIGEGITTVAANAFCREMEMNVYGNVNALNLPSTLTTIGEYAFAYCTGLTVELKDFAGITYPANAFTQVGCVVGTLLDNANNANTISVMALASKNNVTLTGRTLYKDGDWNTLTLPFDLGDEDASRGHEFDGTPLEGATVKALANSESSGTGYDASTGQQDRGRRALSGEVG